ncbi:MAG: tripartite tricarboxylate transporter substrate binding protein [Betaproteobacteria bacterium]|nr:tripartite tricarboxylate transporter substrate binding protein [Betaproteobacteria bacterium]
MKTSILARAAAAILALALPASALAQAWPAKPLKIIVPYSPGGTTDLLARLVGAELAKRLGQPVVVENKPGANGMIGSDLVAKAPPDGYTMGIASPGSHAANQSLYKDIPYDTVKSFTPVSLAVSAPMLLVAHPSLGVSSVKELIAAAKAKPGTISYASGGSGSSQHLAMEYFKLMAGIDMNHVPYKGSAASYPDLLGGNVLTEIDVMPTALPPVKAGRLKGLATGSAKRLPMLPDLPTIAEAGVPGYEYAAWYGFVAPANLPKDVLAKLNAEIVRALKLPEIADKLSGAGVIVVAGTPEEFAAHIKSEMDKAAKVIKAANIKPD